MSSLPRGWSSAQLAELGANDEQTVLTGPFGANLGKEDFVPSGVPVFTIGCLGTDRLVRSKLLYISPDKATELEDYRLRSGDFLFSRMASVGRAGIVPADLEGAIFNYHLMRVRLADEAIQPRLFYYLIRGAEVVESYLKEVSRGATRDGINTKLLLGLPVLLPPFREQRRIVAKIDSLSNQSNRARDHLNHIPRLVEKYKQAVLSAAFRGELTREWRATNVSVDSPDQRLRELKHARGESHSRAVKASEAGNGRIPVKLGELPDSWAVASLEEMTSSTRLIQYGILKPGPHVVGGVPYVKVMNIRGGKIDLDHIRCTTADIAHQYRRASISTGDILLTIRGTVGRLAKVPKVLDGGNITQDSVRIAPLDCVESDYVFWYLHAPTVQQYFSANQKGVAVRGINVGDVRPIEVPLPPREEQREIVRRVSNALAWIDRLAAEATSARKLIDRLDQAVLAKAFRGELVPQDPNDEPASVLLERIKNEQLSSSVAPARRRRKSG